MTKVLIAGEHHDEQLAERLPGDGELAQRRRIARRRAPHGRLACLPAGGRLAQRRRVPGQYDVGAGAIGSPPRRSSNWRPSFTGSHLSYTITFGIAS